MYPEVFNIPTYGLMAGLGLIAAVVFLVVRNKLFFFTTGQLVWICFIAFLGMVAGSKIVFMISRIPAIPEEGSWLNFLMEELFTGGYVFYGGVLGAYFGLYFLSRSQMMSYRMTTSLVTPAFCLFHMFGRLGCLLGGCCYGVETEHFGVMIDGVLRFPVQAIEAGVELVLLLVIIGIENRELRNPKMNTDGEFMEKPLAQIYLFWYSVIRFVLEFFRGDEIRGFFGPLSTSQWIALIVIVVIGGMKCRRVVSRRKCMD